MNTTTILILISLSLNFFSSDNTTSPQTNDINEIRDNWTQFIQAWEAEDAKTCAGFYTSDGINIPNGFEANTGREAIEQFYHFLFSNNQSSTYTHTTHNLQLFGDHAFEYGEFSVNWVTNEGAEWTYRARMMAHWEKSPDEGWKIRTLMFNLPPESQN